MDINEKTPASFEDALKELEDIVNELELGDIELEKSLALYERGIVLSNYLKVIIDEGKAKIKTLAKQNDVIVENDFITED